MTDQAMGREELKRKIDNITRFLTYPDLDDLHAIDDCDAALREELAALGKLADEDGERLLSQICTLKVELARAKAEAFAVAASQCEDPIADENGHIWCGRVKELERQLAQVKEERQDMIWERDDLLDQVGKLNRKIAELGGRT